MDHEVRDVELVDRGRHRGAAEVPVVLALGLGAAEDGFDRRPHGAPGGEPVEAVDVGCLEADVPEELAGSEVTTWSTTSAALQPAHGEGAAQPASGTASTTTPKRSASVR